LTPAVAAPLPFSGPQPIPSPEAPRVVQTLVFVRGMHIQAEIGIYDQEHGRTQPLICDVELTLDAQGFEHITDTVNYETILARAQAIAAEGHLKLVETFAERLAFACFDDPRTTKVRVRVEKPEALAPDAEAAGVELVVARP
jgi:dihydroneopterin aldolase